MFINPPPSSFISTDLGFGCNQQICIGQKALALDNQSIWYHSYKHKTTI